MKGEKKKKNDSQVLLEKLDKFSSTTIYQYREDVK